SSSCCSSPPRKRPRPRSRQKHGGGPRPRARRQESRPINPRVDVSHPTQPRAGSQAPKADTPPSAVPTARPVRGRRDDDRTHYSLLAEDDRALALGAFASVCRFSEKAAQCLLIVGQDLAAVRDRLGPVLADRWAAEEFGWPASTTA